MSGVVESCLEADPLLWHEDRAWLVLPLRGDGRRLLGLLNGVPLYDDGLDVGAVGQWCRWHKSDAARRFVAELAVTVLS